MAKYLFYFVVVHVLFLNELMPHAYANSGPIWQLTALTPTTLAVPSNRRAIVKYEVNNRTQKQLFLMMKPISGISQITTGANVCSTWFTLNGLSSCTLILEIDGSIMPSTITGGPLVCRPSSNKTPNPNSCYQPSPNNQLNISRTAPNLITLESSVSALALSVNCPVPSPSCAYSNPALTGNSRILTITNPSEIYALNVGFTATNLPTGTSITPMNCGNIAPGGSCDLTITPGSEASVAPGVVTITGMNTNPLLIRVNVLTYGSIYQSGYVFAVDDSSPPATSIGGKVASLVDQSAGIMWDSCISGSCTVIAANSYLDGAANTANIYNALSTIYSPNTFAAGLCYQQSIDGYNDWYLPSLCEMGYLISSPCGDATNPTLQNMQTNLVDNGLHLLSDVYWSSTQYPINTLIYTYFNYYDDGNAASGDFKDVEHRVRCIRVLTP